MNSKEALKYHPRYQLECHKNRRDRLLTWDTQNFLVDWGETYASCISKGIKWVAVGTCMQTMSSSLKLGEINQLANFRNF